jgi:DNA-binding transcriptional ArsR family regulator
MTIHSKLLYKKLEQYFYRNILKKHKRIGCTMLVYFCGIPFFENEQDGCCNEIKVYYSKLAFNSGIAIATIGKHLKRLHQWGLIELHTGGQKPDRVTRIRRLTFNEIKATIHPGEENSPQHAIKLASIMNQREFTYGNEKCQPLWKPTKTGRIMSRNPNVQGENQKERKTNLKAGLDKGEYLFELDIDRAEPTVILNRLYCESFFDRTFSNDPYIELAN